MLHSNTNRGPRFLVLQICYICDVTYMCRTHCQRVQINARARVCMVAYQRVIINFGCIHVKVTQHFICHDVIIYLFRICRVLDSFVDLYKIIRLCLKMLSNVFVLCVKKVRAPTAQQRCAGKNKDLTREPRYIYRVCGLSRKSYGQMRATPAILQPR